jgi:hypothetical protein
MSGTPARLRPLIGQAGFKGCSMWIDIDDAIQMYARFWRARHGAAGTKAVRQRAEQLKKSGDAEGHRVWSKVAEEIQKQEDVSARCPDDQGAARTPRVVHQAPSVRQPPTATTITSGQALAANR